MVTAERDITLTGVASIAVDSERETMIRQSAAQLERSLSWVLNKIMELSWDGYFKQYPLHKTSKRRA